jgi:hypothetical protein
VRPAFAIENVARFSTAFALTPLRLFATADVRADLIAAHDFLFGCGDRFFFDDFSHLQAS